MQGKNLELNSKKKFKLKPDRENKKVERKNEPELRKERRGEAKSKTEENRIEREPEAVVRARLGKEHEDQRKDHLWWIHERPARSKVLDQNRTNRRSIARRKKVKGQIVVTTAILRGQSDQE